MEKREIILAVLFATIVLVLLAFFLLFFLVKYRHKSNAYIVEKENLKKEYEQALLQAQIEVQENTLSALGYELHDNIGQLISSAKMLIGIALRTLNHAPDTLVTAEETLGNAVKEVRSLSKSLDKEWLQQFNLVENLQTEVNRINTSQILKINLNHPENLSLSADKQIILFRIIQEAIQNAIKHSQADNIDINITDEVSQLIIKIIDNGKGFKDSEHQLKGLGLKNMKHRTQLLGGTIDWKPIPENGTSIIIHLPNKNNES